MMFVPTEMSHVAMQVKGEYALAYFTDRIRGCTGNQGMHGG